MTLLDVQGLTLRFPGQPRPLLSDISFRVETGERVLLLGPSGSGKSSLLLALTGLVPRSVEAELTGTVLLDGRPVGAMAPQEVCRRVGLLFQEPETQFCMLNPADEVAFGLENLAVSPAEMDGRITAALDAVGLAPGERQRPIHHLSGGQQQRLALASILAQAPDLLLMDEPTANLDPAGRREVVAAATAAAEVGKALLVVEHHLDPWFPLLTRLLLLTPDGRLLDDGPPADLFARWGRYLAEVGVWRPLSVQTAEHLAAAGYPCDPLPLTARDLALNGAPRQALVEALAEVGKEPGREDTAPERSAVLNRPVTTTDRAYSDVLTHQPDEPIAVLSGVTAGYGGGRSVLHGIDLTVRPGECWALVGPNGAGKSTLARTLIGMVRPDAGAVSVLGTPIGRVGARELAHQVGYVFQNPEHQFVTDSVWEELAYSLRQLGLPPEERRARLESALHLFGLEEQKAANPFSLSGGQKRRLSVATMLVGEPRLLILDEPTFGQDQLGARRLMDRIAAYTRAGVAVLMITHDMELVDRYASHAAVLLDGRLAFTGAPGALWQQPDLLKRCDLEPPFRIQVLAHAQEAVPC